MLHNIFHMQTAWLPCGLLHDTPSDNSGWMLHHIFHMQMASLPVGLHHDSSSYNCGWMLDHIFHMQMPSLHVGLFMTLQVTIVNECCITYFTCKCLYSMWVATWLFSWQLWLNVRSHILHANGFTPCGSLLDSTSDNCGWMLDHNFTCKWLLFLLGWIMTLQVTTAVEC